MRSPTKISTTDFMIFGASNVMSSGEEIGNPKAETLDAPTVGKSTAGKLHSELLLQVKKR